MKNTADTLRLGLEAGGHYDHSEDTAEWSFSPEQLEKLISAVRAEERARICRILWVNSEDAPELVRLIKEKT